jgi:hydrogenase-4 component F
MIAILIAVPAIGATLLARATGRLAAFLHATTTVATVALGMIVGVAAVQGVPALAFGGVLRVDALSGWMIMMIVTVAALAAVEAPRYVEADSPGSFYPLFHLMVFTMLLAVSTDDIGVMWVAVEGTTLASVFLVNFERTRASLEAAYKYLLICSVGIALAFIGTVLVYYADVVRQQGIAEHGAHALRWTSLLSFAPTLSPRVLEVAFVFLVVGYGTKAGLAPMHTWLPDAHSEAPAPVSALMSGVLLSVGVYAILRFKPILDASAGAAFTQRILLSLGLLSLGVAAVFLWTPRNYKRMLAYSSVEHIGIVCLGLGFGGPLGIAGALLHIANHGLSKSLLFLIAGRIRAAYGTVDLSAVRGLLAALPYTARAFLMALLALLGLPPFGLFTSNVMIFGAGFKEGHSGVAGIGLALLVIAFGGLLRAAHGMLYGTAPEIASHPADDWLPAVPMAVALTLLVLTGLAWPPGLAAALDLAARVVTR